MVRRIRIGWMAALTMVLAAAACGDATSVDPDDIAGTWNATAAVVSNPADASESEDVLALGMSFQFVMRSDGTMTGTIDVGLGPEVEDGTYSIAGGTITIALAGDPATGTLTRSGDNMTIVITDGIEWEFDGAVGQVPAYLTLDLVRS